MLFYAVLICMSLLHTFSVLNIAIQTQFTFQSWWKDGWPRRPCNASHLEIVDATAGPGNRALESTLAEATRREGTNKWMNKWALVTQSYQEVEVQSTCGLHPALRPCALMPRRRKEIRRNVSVRPFTIYTALHYLQHDAQSWILVTVTSSSQESACCRGASTSSPITDVRAIGLHEACIWITILIPKLPNTTLPGFTVPKWLQIVTINGCRLRLTAVSHVILTLFPLTNLGLSRMAGPELLWFHDRSLFMRNDLPTYIRPTKGCTEETGRHWVPFAIFNIFNALQIICAPITLTFYRYHYSPIVYSTCTNLHVFICIYLHWVEYILKIISSVLIYTSMLFVPAVPHLRTLALSMVDTFILYLTAKQAYTMESFAGLAMRGPGQLQNVTAV